MLNSLTLAAWLAYCLLKRELLHCLLLLLLLLMMSLLLLLLLLLGLLLLLLLLLMMCSRRLCLHLLQLNVRREVDTRHVARHIPCLLHRCELGRSHRRVTAIGKIHGHTAVLLLCMLLLLLLLLYHRDVPLSRNQLCLHLIGLELLMVGNWSRQMLAHILTVL